MAKNDNTSKDFVFKEGVIVEQLKNTQFRVQLDEPDNEGAPQVVKAVLAGKLRKIYTRVLMGDRVRLRFSPYDMSLGMIVYCFKKKR